MRIVRLEVWPVEFGLRRPYEIAYERVESVTNVFLRLVTDGPHVGHGCAAPDPAVTGEAPERVRESLEGAGDVLRGSDPLRVAALLERAAEALPGAPSSLAALDMALHDLMGRVAGLPLWRLLGGYRERMATSVTIGILAPEETVRAARERVGQGFRVLKLKGGRDAEGDVERVRRVREAVGPHVELRFDANQGYTLEDSIRFVEGVRDVGLELLEQPTPRGEPQLLARVTSAVQLPVMADESLMSLRDAYRLVRGELADMVNVKLMKVGGLAEAVRIKHLARAAGLEVMVGCMDEAALAIAAGLAFALAGPSVVYADLDGHLDLVDDPSAGAVLLQDGELVPAPGPGLGFELEP